MKLSVSASSLNRKEHVAMQLHDFKMNMCKTLNSNFLQQFNTETPIKEKTKKNKMNKSDSSEKKRQKKKVQRRVTFSKSPTPCMPVKVNPNANYTMRHGDSQKTVSYDNTSLNDSDIELSNEDIYSAYFNIIGDEAIREADYLVKSECQSSFLLRRTSVTRYDLDDMKQAGNDDYADAKHDEQLDLRTNFALNHSSSLSTNSSTVSTLTTGTQSDSGMSSLNSAQLFFAEIREHLISDCVGKPRAVHGSGNSFLCLANKFNTQINPMR